MDEVAKAHLQTILETSSNFPDDSPTPRAIYGEGVCCVLDGVKMTSLPDTHLLASIYASQMREHLLEKGTLSRHLFSRVDWVAIERALVDRAPSFQTWMTKHVSGHCVVG